MATKGVTGPQQPQRGTQNHPGVRSSAPVQHLGERTEGKRQPGEVLRALGAPLQCPGEKAAFSRAPAVLMWLMDVAVVAPGGSGRAWAGEEQRSQVTSLAVPCIPLVLGSSACSESGPHINGEYSPQNSSSRSPNTIKFLNFKFQIGKKK